MQFIDFKEQLRRFAVFNISDIRKIETDFDLRRLNEWTKKGYIKNVRKGYYIFSDLQINERSLFLIANTIYQPSYISLEMAFSIYNLIPESVYCITSVTSKKTNEFKTKIGNFTYKHIKPELFFGYSLQEYGEHRYMIAEIEKALLDYMYLNPHIKNTEDFKGLRINISEFKLRVDMEKFDKYLKAFHSKALSIRINNFLAYIKNA